MSANEMPGIDTPIVMTYRNYRGEIAERCIIPDRVRFGSTDWHPEPGWLLHAFDTDKGAFRDFALADCQFADLTPAPQPSETVTEAAKLADAIEACDWSGSPIGNKMILRAAVKALRALKGDDANG